MEKLKLTITLDGDRTYKFCPSLKTNITFDNPITIDWGDNSQTIAKSMRDIKHKYQKDISSAIITINDSDNLFDISFKNDTKIVEVEGVLPKRSGIEGMFENCENLRKVSPLFLQHYRNSDNVSRFFKGCKNYKDGTLVLTILRRIQVADETFAECNLISDNLGSINFNLFTYTTSMRGFLKNNFLTSIGSIPFDKLALVQDLSEFFKGNQLINGYVPVLKNVNLEKLDDFLTDSSNIIIDKNWLYYLKNANSIDIYNIFHKDIVLNGM